MQGQARAESVYEESSATQTRMYDALNTANAQQAHTANQQATQQRTTGAQQGMAPYSSVRLSEHTILACVAPVEKQNHISCCYSCMLCDACPRLLTCLHANSWCVRHAYARQRIAHSACDAVLLWCRPHVRTLICLSCLPAALAFCCITVASVTDEPDYSTVPLTGSQSLYTDNNGTGNGTLALDTAEDDDDMDI